MKRFDRQLPLLGSEGQARLRGANVVVVGLGGLGSHAVQQLAYLGVGRILGIDPDRVDVTNLNRLVGATPEDARAGRTKVEVMRRMVTGIAPGTEFEGHEVSVMSKAALAALADADLVLGCVDLEGVRLVLTEYCAAYEVPYIDAATDVVTDGGLEYGGRVVSCTSDAGCLVCTGELDAAEAGDDLAGPAEREARDRIYGVPAAQLGRSGPSVVTINGVIASVAAMEAMVHLTGLREPILVIRYRGSVANRTPVTIRTERDRDECYICQSLRGLGAGAKVERYFNDPPAASA